MKREAVGVDDYKDYFGFTKKVRKFWLELQSNTNFIVNLLQFD